MIYLDYAATSPLLPEVKEAMLAAMDHPANASALHTPGHQAMNVIEEARAAIAKLINASPEEIIFTSGGSEANNTVMNIFAGEAVAVSTIEHPSVLEAAKARCKCTKLPVDGEGVAKLLFDGRSQRPSSRGCFASCGVVTPHTIKKDFATPSTPLSASSERPPKRSFAAPVDMRLVSIMLANNELGTIQPIKALAEQAHQLGALFHTDATQALGKIPVDVKDLDVDYLTISAHKIGGPVGVGALYVRRGAPYRPLIIGGHQEHGRRAGTYQTANIAGFGAAAQYALTHNTPEQYQRKIRPLRDQLARRILAEIPHSSINGAVLKHPAKSLPNILNASFQAAEGESIQLYLDAEGEVIVSTGSACAAGDGRPSHVLMATSGGDAEVAHSSIRISMGLDTTQRDIDQLMQYLPGIVRRLQGISTIKIKDKD